MGISRDVTARQLAGHADVRIEAPAPIGAPVFDVGPITMTVKEFSRWSGLGVTKIYELIAPGGPLKTVLIGKRRLIVVQSYRDLIASQQQDPRAFIPSPNPKASTYVGPGGYPADEPQTPRGRGRPKGSKNRPKSTAAAPGRRSRGRTRGDRPAAG